MKGDEGVVLAADDKPHRGKSVTESVFDELARLARSQTPADATYGIHQLDAMSGGGRHKLHDFARPVALEVVAKRIGARNAAVATAAISAVGGESPYLEDTQTPYWLAGMGRGEIRGMAPLRPSGKNQAADEHRAALLAVANGTGLAQVRALAIRALGRGVPSAPIPDTTRWLADPEPLVRQSAVVLLADAPGAASTRTIGAAAADPAVEVRVGAARAIGFGQLQRLLPVLGRLVKDPAAPVRKAAALSLLAFDPGDAGAVLKANLDSDFRPLFVNALARRNPVPYVAALGEIIRKQLVPADFWGGRIPAADAWDILFRYVRTQPASDFRAGKLDATLDSLEKQRWFSSSEPRSLYALYLVRGLPERARKLRAACKRTVGFDMAYYLDMADKNPTAYVD